MNRPYFFDMCALLDHPLLATLAELSRSFPGTGSLHLVGGAIRDALLDRPVADFDFASPSDPTPIARSLARQRAGNWFWLDRQRRQSRVIIDATTFDFAPFRAATLIDDLAARDFTINAMALDMAGPLAVDLLIDPLGGRDDLERRLLRTAGAGVLDDDPLRILKGIRHAVELDLAIEPATLDAMRHAAPALAGIAPERLRLEMWRILASPSAARGVAELVGSGAGEVLFGKNFSQSTPSISQGLSHANDLFAALAAVNPEVKDWLSAPVEQGLTRATLLRWHMALHAVESGLPLKLARRWRFGRSAIARLNTLATLSRRLWPELLALPRKPRPIAQWTRQYGTDSVEVLVGLGLLAGLESGLVAEQLNPLLAILAEMGDPDRVPPLVDGAWLVEELGLDGRMIGEALNDLRQAEIRGEVESAADARQYLRQHYPKGD